MYATTSAWINVPARLAQELCLLAIESSKQLLSLLTNREVPRLLVAKLSGRARVRAIPPWLETQVATRLHQADLMHLASDGRKAVRRAKTDQVKLTGSPSHCRSNFECKQLDNLLQYWSTTDQHAQALAPQKAEISI